MSNNSARDEDELKRQLCDIGKRIYDKGFAAANEGNLSVRLDKNHVLCTPTLHCKGFMTPEDICTVDMQGTQVAGKRKRTSEVMLHLEIYQKRPDVDSVVHCHPPHATAFAVAREPIPTCVLPEPDIFLGEVPIAPYETPGGKGFAETILPFVDQTSIIVLANHGTVSYEAGLEKAYWLTEILDAYCRILMLARQLGNVEYVSPEKGRELLQMRLDWGFADSRDVSKDAKKPIIDFALFKEFWAAANLEQKAFAAHPGLDARADDHHSPAPSNADSTKVELSEDQLEQLADKIASRLKKQS
ncbi:MAG: class II aldolase/adducin family protein [Planctomycetota bacterium]